jgi:hypothetical protein
MVLRLFLGACLLSTSVLAQSAFAYDSAGLQIIVSKSTQSLAVYDNGELIKTSKVSTGKPGHDTPTGIFSILEKRKYHESNIYSNAPMPFMQRLTWSGIALHEGKVPNYPASHGCIRLPAGFAQSLYGKTERGVHVIVSEKPVEPQRIWHSTLFQPTVEQPDGNLLLSDVELRPASFDPSLKVEVAMNEHTNSVTPETVVKPTTKPMRILITRRGDREKMVDIQTMLNTLGFDAGKTDGQMGQMTISAINGFKRWKGLSEKGTAVTDAFVTALYAASGYDAPPAGQLQVRQDFQPLFEVAVGIKDPNLPLGTHFMEATAVDHADGRADWYSITLENHLPAATMRRLGIDADKFELQESASEVLDRIDIPKDARKRIEDLLVAGTSITITDLSHFPETGQGTDFITITKTIRRPS